MNFLGNIFGGKGHGDKDCCCSLIWILVLLSVCGNGCGIGDIFGGDCCSIILLLILLSSCGCGCGCNDMGGCRG